MVLTACLRGSSTTLVPSTTSDGSDEIVPAAHDVFRDVVERWPHGIYDARALINQLQPRLEQQQRPTSATSKKSSPSASAALKRAAASLYAQLGQHNAALRLLLELRSPSIFDYIKNNALQALAANFAADLIELEEVKATQLFVQAVEEAPPAVVVASLQSKISEIDSKNKEESSVWSLRLYHYVDWLWQKEISPTGSGISTTTTTPNGSFPSSLSELHIELCATHDPSRLMYILTSSSSYPLDAALQICQSHSNLIRECVYLLGRMGSSDAALRLIITQLRDVQGAVKFVQDNAVHDDSSLWELLISLTLGDAALTGALLDHAPTGGGGGGGGGCVDPLRLVESIPEDIKIERLRDRLIRVMTDFKATVSLQSGCNAVLRADCLKLADQLYGELRRALKTVFVLKPGGRWSTESNGDLGAVSGLSEVEVSGSRGGGEGEGAFPFEILQLQQQQQIVWVGNTKKPASSGASRKSILTPPPSVHTSPSKFPPSNRNKSNTKPQGTGFVL